MDTYLYRFSFVPPNSLFPGMGAFHGSELAYVFSNPWTATPFADAEKALSLSMIGYWGRFADSSDPNGDDAILWPKYLTDTDLHLILDTEISTGTGLNKDKCDFWSAFGM